MFAQWSHERERRVRDLFDVQYRPLCRLAYVILRDAAQAEEAVMDAFVKTFAGWRRIGMMDRPDLYVRRAVVNACTSRLRRRSIESRHLDDHRPITAADFDTQHLVRAAIDELPKRQRLCVVLRYFEDLSEADMAEVLGCSPGTIKSQLSKARVTLKAILEAGDEVKGETHA